MPVHYRDAGVGIVQDLGVGLGLKVYVEVVGEEDRLSVKPAYDRRSGVDPEKALGPVQQAEGAVDILRPHRSVGHRGQHALAIAGKDHVEGILLRDFNKFRLRDAERGENAFRKAEDQHLLHSRPQQIGYKVSWQPQDHIFYFSERKIAVHFPDQCSSFLVPAARASSS